MTREPRRNEEIRDKRKRHDRILLRLLQPLDLSRVPQHPAAGEGVRGGDPWRPILVGGIFNTVNPSVYAAREHPVPAEAGLPAEGHAGLGAVGGARDQVPADRVSGQQRQGDARLHPARATGQAGAVRARGVRGLLGRGPGHLAGTRCWPRSARASASTRQAFFAGIAQQAIKDQLKANTDELIAPRRLRLADHLRRRRRHVFRQRPPAADPRGAGATQSERGLMPRAVVCRELGPPERLQLESFPRAPLQAGECGSRSAPPGSIFRTF